jgi:hypothetical protein
MCIFCVVCFWYHSPNVLDTLHICNIRWLRVNALIINILKPTGNFTCLKVFNIYIFYIVITRNVFILYGSRNKQEILSYKTLKDRVLQRKLRGFTARYGLSPYITQIRLVFKCLISIGHKFRGFLEGF